MFDVARPLRKTKLVVLPDGEQKVVDFFYEKIQKRCYNCQRLNHERDVCRLLVKERQERFATKREKIIAGKKDASLFLPPTDPLFGVLDEDKLE